MGGGKKMARGYAVSELSLRYCGVHQRARTKNKKQKKYCPKTFAIVISVSPPRVSARFVFYGFHFNLLNREEKKILAQITFRVPLIRVTCYGII